VLQVSSCVSRLDWKFEQLVRVFALASVSETKPCNNKDLRSSACLCVFLFCYAVIMLCLCLLQTPFKTV